ncbi:hypothetical protein [Caudoviricetes sp.]|nr:hypothetical protein [Caudoviricetes sp.]
MFARNLSTFNGGESSAGEASGEATQQTGNLEQLYSTIEDTSRRAEAAEARAQQHEAVLSKLQSVFAGEQPEADPLSWHDDVLLQALEAEKAGKPIPLTLKIANQLAEAQKQVLEQQRQMQHMQQRLQNISSPEAQADMHAYTQLDSKLQNTIEQIYGEARPEVYKAITERIVNDLKTIQKNAPSDWKYIRNSPEAQGKFINHYLKQHVPPQAMQMLQEHKLANTDLPEASLIQAIREARQVRAETKDPRERAAMDRAISEARAMIWQQKAERNRR